MKFSATIHLVLLLAATTSTALTAPPHSHPKLASPWGQPSKKDRAAAVRDRHFNNLGKNSIEDAVPTTSATSSNWAGAELTPPSGETFQSITATMTLPELTAPDVAEGPADEYFLYVWVGIDGDGACSDALWQTGFAGQIIDDVTSWWGWVCFIWGDEIHFDTMILDASSGDSVNMTVQSLSSSEGIFWLENLSTGQTKSYDVAGGDLCGDTAEWIVEDPFDESSTGAVEYFLVWPEFGTMTFDGAVAYTKEGTSVGPEDATLYVIDNFYSGITQNSASVTDDTVSVKWVASGPAT